MTCNDSLCQKLNTCKWDMPVSPAYCGNMYSPSLNKSESHVVTGESTSAITDLRREVDELKAEIRSLNSNKPASQREYKPEYVGRRRDANRRQS